MLTEDCLIHIGEIINTHGYKGHLKIKFSDRIDIIIDNKSVIFFKINNKPVPFFVKEIDYINPEISIILFEDIDSKEEAQKFLKTEIFSHKDNIALAEVEEVAELDLIEFTVIDQNNIALGKIVNIHDNSSQILFEVRIIDKIKLVPFHEDFLINLDKTSKTIQIEITDGLLDI